MSPDHPAQDPADRPVDGGHRPDRDGPFAERLPDYLAGLDAPTAATPADVNAPGIDRMHGYLGSGRAVAFPGAGTSAPLYPLWGRRGADRRGRRPRSGRRGRRQPVGSGR